MSIADQHQVEELYAKAADLLHKWRIDHYFNFTGTLVFNVDDAQAMAVEQAERDWRNNGFEGVQPKPVVHSGDPFRLFGTQCRADGNTPMGCVGMERADDE